MNFLLGDGMRQIIDSIAVKRKPQPVLARRPTSPIPPGPGERRPTRFDGWWHEYGGNGSLAFENMPHRAEHELFGDLRRY